MLTPARPGRFQCRVYRSGVRPSLRAPLHAQRSTDATIATTRCRLATQELAEKASTDYKKTQTAEGGDAETETDPTKKGKKPPPVKPPAKKAKVDKVDVAVVEKKVEAPKLEAPKKAPKD